MAAVERAADVQTSKRKSAPQQAVVKVNGIPVENVFCPVHRTVGDVALSYNLLEPKLGDRVINLTCPGVPFGLKGTVVTIHSNTKFVEVQIFPLRGAVNRGLFVIDPRIMFCLDIAYLRRGVHRRQGSPGLLLAVPRPPGTLD
jgi:hypothetical protein